MQTLSLNIKFICTQGGKGEKYLDKLCISRCPYASYKYIYIQIPVMYILYVTYTDFYRYLI